MNEIKITKYLKDYFLTYQLDNFLLHSLCCSSKFKKFEHYEPMLSLSNSFNLSDSEDFFEKATNYLKKKNSNYIFYVDCKIDGVSLSLIYKKLHRLFKNYLSPL